MKTIRQLMTALILMISMEGFGQAPTITGFSPASGPVGTVMTITGTNLSNPTAFSIGGVSAIVVSNTGTSLVGMVMPGAVTGAVSVSTAGGTATGADFTVMPTQHPATQLGSKLVGSGETGAAQFGYSISISADGKTAIVGGPFDNNNTGAVWIFVNTGGVWTQQGPKLVGTGAIGAAEQGWSVGISADGNTAVEGGWADNIDSGAVWIFVRSGTTWSQQGLKLVGTGTIYGNQGAMQGWSSAISADGNTVIEGGLNDNSETGAAWTFTRSGTTWSQQGPKLVGTGAVSLSNQGSAVALSADGNTAIVGGYADDGNVGAAWVYTRSGGIWTQQGPKLVGTGYIWEQSAVGVWQGNSVSLSADGNTAAVAGYYDANDSGAVWVYTRSGGAWTQQGSKLVGTGASGRGFFGTSIALSADGNTLVSGGFGDSAQFGATWVFTRSGGIWTQQGSKLVGMGAASPAGQGGSVSLSADGNTAIVSGFTDNGNIGAAWVFTPCNTCGPDSTVWPGDADANHIVDNNDLLPIGLAYDSTGPVRTVQGIVWQGDIAANWNDTLPGYSPAVNFKYADCDGNGIINADDTLAIVTNFGDTHAKTNNLPGPWRSGIPALYPVITSDTLYNNDTLITNIFLGDSAQPVNGIYGLAFTFNYDPLVIDSNTSSFSFIPSWLGTSANSININRNFTTGQVKAAITGIDHSARSGNGQVASFRGIVTTDNINGKDYSYYLNHQYISDITAIDQYGNRLSLNAGIDSNYVGWFVNGIRPVSAPTLSIYPDPASTQVRISADVAISSVTITDILGEVAQTINGNNQKSEMIDVSQLSAGVYTVRVSSAGGTATARLVVSR